MSDSYDVIIIGSGPGGYVAAIKSAQLGFKTAIVECEKLGGICLNWGCIPTKTLLRSAEIYSYVKRAKEFGINLDDKKVGVNFPDIVKRSRAVAEQLSKGVTFLMKKNKIKVYDGWGKIKDSNQIEITHDKKTVTLNAKNIIIATGARARKIEGLEIDKKQVLSYREAMNLDSLPKSLLIVGSGAIGIEFACFYNTLGTKVIVVEAQDNILPYEDKEISSFAKKEFEKQGIDFINTASVNSLKKEKNSVTVDISIAGKIKQVKAEKVIMAVGIVGNIENIGLENTNVITKNNSIVTDKFCQTAEKNIFAIGDVAGAPQLAHKASHEAIICLNKIANKSNHILSKNNIPSCIYSHPQVASVGLTEQQAKEKYEINVGRFPFIGNGKAIAMGESEGMIKTIFDRKTGELLGAHLVGAEVTEMIQGFVIGKTMEATEEDFMNTVFPHPTISEMMHESVLDAYGKAIHI